MPENKTQLLLRQAKRRTKSRRRKSRDIAVILSIIALCSLLISPTIGQKSAAPQPVLVPQTNQEIQSGPILSLEDRTLIEKIVMASAEGESREGQMAVAQAILQVMANKNITIQQAMADYHYPTSVKQATQSVKDAVWSVFYEGQRVVEGEILYFYNPKIQDGAWHEARHYVTTIGSHKFFND